MKKRFVALCVLLSMLPIYFNCYAKETTEDENFIKIYKTFEEDNDKENFDRVTGNYEITKDDNGSKGVYVCGNRTTTTGTLRLPKNVDKNVLEVSFDYKNTGWRERFYIRMFAGTRGDVAETFSDRGVFGYYLNGVGWDVADHRKAYTTNKWYRISMFINMDTRMVYYYCDGKLYGYTSVKEGFPDIRYFEFICQGTYEQTMIDNLCAIEYKSDDDALPEEVRWSAFTNTRTNNYGRIYYSKDEQKLIVTAGNKTGADGDFDLKCKILKSGREVYTHTQEIHLTDGEVKDFEITAKTDGYGYYDMLPQLYDKEGNLLFEGIEYRYSVTNTPPEGLKSERDGVQIKTNVEINKTDVENVDLPLMSRLGFSFTRGGGGWGNHRAVGEWWVDSWGEYSTGKYYEHGFEQIPILAFGNSKITAENPPRSEWALEQFAWNAARVCEWYEKKQGYPLKNIDVWNEYWMGGSAFNQDNATPEDYANMLKAVYPAVKEVSPPTIVWGLSGVTRDHFEWTERILKAGGGDYMDGFTLHPYNNKGSADGADYPKLINAYKELFAKYGYTDKLCWVSEWGWPSCDQDGYPDERHQAAYYIESNVIFTGYDLVDMTTWYCSNDVENDNGQESRFGLNRGAFAEVGYEAKPSYLTVGNYMNLMISSEHIKNYDISDNVTLYQYKLRDGRDILIGWAKQYSEAASLKIDTNQLTICDMYGNEQLLTGQQNEFSFMFTDIPIYIIGKFSDVSRVDTKITMEESEVSMVRGDKTAFTIKKNFPQDATVELDLPGGVRLVENNGFVGNECEIIVESEVTEKEEDEIPIKIIVDGKTVFTYNMYVTYIQPIDFSITTRPYSSNQVDRWQAIIKVKGNFYDERVEGKLHIKAPSQMATGGNPIKIPKVGPSEERIVKVNIPKSVSSDTFTLKATLEMEGYETLEVDETVNLRCSTFMKNKPTIDGKVNAGEWDIRTVMLMNNPKNFFKLGSSKMYGGLSDLSAKVYTGWDYENFYLAAEVTDNEWAWHESLLWSSDGIQFAMAPSKQGTQMAQIDIGSMNGETRVLMEISTNAANVGPVELAEFDMSRSGKITTYELRIPWKEIFPDGYILRKNSSVPFSMLINDNDGTGRKGYMENGGGIGDFKNVYEFLDLFLLF